MNRSTLLGAALLTVVLVAGWNLRLAANRTVASDGAPAAENASSEGGRAAIRRALPYLARQTGSWIEEKKCTSCHQVPHALWAMNDARKGGFVVDDRLTEWNRWSVEFVLRKAQESDGNELGARERADELYQLLLSGAVAEAGSDAQRPEPSAGVRDQLSSLLRVGRNEDRSWNAGGRLPDQRRPNPETDEVTTMWSLLTLRSAGEAGGQAQVVNQRRDVKPEAPSASLEHLMLRYLLASHDSGSEEASALRNQILSYQNDDGGWGWLLDGPSDALATGQALYALTHMEWDHRRDAVRRAHQFLLHTQQPDGSWYVPSTLKEGDGQPYVVSNDWGTAWAVIGLARTLDP